MAIHTLSDLEDYPEVAKALGEMIIAWARMDAALIGALTRISGASLDQMQRGFHHLPTFDTRIRFIRSLIADAQIDGFDKEKIDKCVEKIGKLASARNHWVHGDWCNDSELNLPVIFDHRTKQSGATKKPVRAADIKNHVGSVHDRAGELEDLVKFQELVDAQPSRT